MKILAFADLHGNLRAVQKLLLKIRRSRPDVIVCAGDLSNFGYGLRTLLKKFELGIPFLIIPGNHETPEELTVYSKSLKSVHCIHLRSFILANIIFIGCGGGGFTSHHAEFEQSEAKFAASIKKLKLRDHRYKVVLVVHQPPYGTALDYIYGEHAGSSSIRKFIEQHQPELCICAHLHENAGKSDRIGRTKILNPGPKGKIIKF